MIPASQHPTRNGQGLLCPAGSARVVRLLPSSSLESTDSSGDLTPREEGHGVTVPIAPPWNQRADPVFIHSAFNCTNKMPILPLNTTLQIKQTSMPSLLGHWGATFQNNHMSLQRNPPTSQGSGQSVAPRRNLSGWASKRKRLKTGT